MNSVRSNNRRLKHKGFAQMIAKIKGSENFSLCQKLNLFRLNKIIYLELEVV